MKISRSDREGLERMFPQGIPPAVLDKVAEHRQLRDRNNAAGETHPDVLAVLALMAGASPALAVEIPSAIPSAMPTFDHVPAGARVLITGLDNEPDYAGEFLRLVTPGKAEIRLYDDRQPKTREFAVTQIKVTTEPSWASVPTGTRVQADNQPGALQGRSADGDLEVLLDQGGPKKFAPWHVQLETGTQRKRRFARKAEPVVQEESGELAGSAVGAL